MPLFLDSSLILWSLYFSYRLDSFAHHTTAYPSWFSPRWPSFQNCCLVWCRFFPFVFPPISFCSFSMFCRTKPSRGAHTTSGTILLLQNIHFVHTKILQNLKTLFSYREQTVPAEIIVVDGTAVPTKIGNISVYLRIMWSENKLKKS